MREREAQGLVLAGFFALELGEFFRGQRVEFLVCFYSHHNKKKEWQIP